MLLENVQMILMLLLEFLLYNKARKWFERAVILNPDLDDLWAKYYALELEVGTKERQDRVKERCVAAEPKHGQVWCSIMKDMRYRGRSVARVWILWHKQ